MNEELEAQLRAIFREEAAEILDELRVVVARLRAADERELREEIALAMRLAHNLKGAAGSVGFEEVARTAHALEEAMLGARAAGAERVRALAGLFGETVAALEAATSGRGQDAFHDVREKLLASTSGAGARGDSATVSVAPEAGPHDADAEAVERTAAERPAEVERAQELVEDATARGGATLRIEAARLDRLFGFVSELLVTETDMRQRHEAWVAMRDGLSAVLRELPASSRERASMTLRRMDALVDDHQRAIGSFSRLSHDLHDAMKRARMVPLETLAASFRRSVDEVARSLGKQVELELELGGIELDKVVLERLRDPLLHLLRNAVDHGIEAARERDLLGKPAMGLISLRAEVVGSTVHLVLADDGGGIDLDALRNAVERKGLVTGAELATLDETTLLDFLFAEGFSTRSRATMVSGRGVGLDVVRRAVVELGGRVTVDARGPLGGAAFHLQVPLSVLSTRMLLVRGGDALFVVPVHAIDRVARVSRRAVGVAAGQAVVTLEGDDPRPLHWLARSFGGRVTQETEQLRLLVLSHGSHSIAVAVDDILVEEDYVVRRLPWNLTDVAGVSGAVILPDGTVALAVDVRQFFARRSIASAAREETRGRARLLVVDDSMTTRTLHRNLLTQAGYEVVVASDGSEAWERLRLEAFDLVVSDVQMPGLDGFELTRRVRADARLGNLPMVLVTSLARSDDVQRGLDAGADEYVVKGPLEEDALLAAVARHVG